MIFLNARSKASSSVSAPTSLAVSMNRFDCSGSSRFDFGFAAIGRTIPQSGNGSHNWRGSLHRQCRLRYRSYRSFFAPRSMSRFVGEPTALRAFEGQRGAGNVVHAKFFAVAVPKVKLSKVAMKVRFADVLVNAVDAAFQDRKETLDGVGVNDPEIAIREGVRLGVAHVFVFPVLDGAVSCEIIANSGEGARLIGHEVAFGRCVLIENCVKVLAANVRQMERPHATFALDQRHNRVHLARAAQ